MCAVIPETWVRDPVEVNFSEPHRICVHRDGSEVVADPEPVPTVSAWSSVPLDSALGGGMLCE